MNLNEIERQHKTGKRLRALTELKEIVGNFAIAAAQEHNVGPFETLTVLMSLVNEIITHTPTDAQTLDVMRGLMDTHIEQINQSYEKRSKA